MFHPGAAPRWINQGKAGVMAERGLPVGGLEDPHPFIRPYEIWYEGMDADMMVDFIQKAPQKDPPLHSGRLDQGYYSPDNWQTLDQMRGLNGMPRKGRGTPPDPERETAPDLAAACQPHPAVESAIHNLHHRGYVRRGLRDSPARGPGA